MVDALYTGQTIVCYLVLCILTVIGIFTDKFPIQVSITLHSMMIICVGSFKSVEQMIKQIKDVHIYKKTDGAGIE